MRSITLRRQIPLIAAVAILALIGAFTGTAQQQPAKASANKPPAAVIPPAKPGPEMVQLDFLIGSWHNAEKYEKTAMYPNGGTGKGTYAARRGPGGFSLVSEFVSDNPGGHEVGHEVITWDTADKVYKSYLFGNTFPGCFLRAGRWEGKDLIFEGDFAMGNDKLHLKSIITQNAPGKATLTDSYSMNGAPLQLMITTAATKAVKK